MTKCILLCGPPRSGKDSLGRELVNVARGNVSEPVFVWKFAYCLKQAVHRAFGLDPSLGTEHFDAVKDIPSKYFHGATPRQAYIAYSEKFAKPLFGSRYFGERLAEVVSSYPDHVAVVTDSGFREEADALVDRLGAENVMLVRLWRPGTSFEGDSRSYWEPAPGVRVLSLRNEGPPESLRGLAAEVLRFAGFPL